MRYLGIIKETLPWRPTRRDRIDLKTEGLGAVIGALLVIPQGITFAYLAGLPPEYGIYGAIFVTLFASLFGTSAMLGGPNTAVAILIGVAVTPFAGRGSPLYIDYVLLLTFMVGVLQLLVWLARGGKYFQYLSPAAITGITVGVGVLLVFSSIDGIFGRPRTETTFFYQKFYTLVSDWDNLTNVYSLIIGSVTVITGLTAKRLIPRYSMVVAMTAGYLVGLLLMGLVPQVEMEIELLGHIPMRLLPLSSPEFGIEYLLVGYNMLPNAISIALIGLAQSMVIVNQLRSSSDHPINLEKEVFAQGISNTLAAFFSSFAGSGSFNRTAINQSLGVKTPLAGILSSVLVFFVILAIGDLLSYMPMAVVSGTLMLVGVGMIKPREIRRLVEWKSELTIFALTLLTIIFLGLQAGLVTAISLSIAAYMLAASKLVIEITQGISLLKIQVEGHLFYASIDQLRQVLKRHRHESVLLDLTMVTYLDLSATESLASELTKRDEDKTSFIIMVKSKGLLEHFQSSMKGLPVQFVGELNY